MPLTVGFVVAGRRYALTCTAAVGVGSIAAYAVSQTPPIPADESGYRLLSVRTILGPCCTDVGTDLVVDADSGVLIAGRRGGLDLDRDGRSISRRSAPLTR